MNGTLILINPWIYDFAAYDLWSKPLALLYLASFLDRQGYDTHFIDCLNVYHQGMIRQNPSQQPVRRDYGTGKFWREPIPPPLQLRPIQRTYSRYGIHPEIYLKELKKIRNPLAILVTSHMTYWYPGVQEAIQLAKGVFPDVPIILGGTYARLCPEHARTNSGADLIDTEFNLEYPTSLFKLLEKVGLPNPSDYPGSETLPYPAFYQLGKIDYICLLTSRGCPYRCQYCASRFLYPNSSRRSPDEVVEEVLYWNRCFGIRDFAFYDDALLVKAESHLVKILEPLIGLKRELRFHTPNGLHIREITNDLAKLLFRSGFRTIRLGFETSDFDQHHRLDNKIGEGDLETAVQALRRAGFQKKEIGAYTLIGLPEQTADSVMETVHFTEKAGATPYLAEYSPIPHTGLWKEAVIASDYDIQNEPLFHNNTLLPCWTDEQRAHVNDLKAAVREIRLNRT
jgi:radical SAM superfamily enzyme YgiQ (UPF0313 family)